MQGENANKIDYVYNAMVVLHICNRIWGIPSPGYPEKRKSNLDAYQILSSIYTYKPGVLFFGPR